MKIFTAKDPEIRVTAGEEFALQLSEEGPGGFLWEAVFDEQMLRLLSKSRQPADTEDARPAVGAGSEVLFAFEALRPGECSLAMRRKRPWEDQSRETLLIHVQVAPAGRA